MKTKKPRDSGKVIITINGGSSSIKFAAFSAVRRGAKSAPMTRLFSGSIERIGLPDSTLTFHPTGEPPHKSPAYARTPQQAITRITLLLHDRVGRERIAGIGHRIVHGGLNLLKHQRVTPQVIAALKKAQPLDLAHLPGEIALLEAFQNAFPRTPHVACLDTAFHRDMPRIAQLLPIPRRFLDQGVRRFGFHGLSYAYLMQELTHIAGGKTARGKIILAHLGNGASMAAVKNGKPVDTTMAFTPLAGLVMGTRPGDLDPGWLVYLMRTEKLTPNQTDDFISRRCGLIGVSGTSSDMRDLLARRSADPRAAEAVDLFCYRARQWIAALASAMGGLDTLVFSAGIGERAPLIRAQICAGLEFLGVRLDAAANAANRPLISSKSSTAAVRIIATDEESMIARIVRDILTLRHDNPAR